MNEALEALLEEVGINEDIGAQLQTVLEEATKVAVATRETELNEAHQAEVAALNEAHDQAIADLREKANMYGEFIQENLLAKVGEYANYAVEEFIKENRERFVETEEYQRMRSVFGLIKESFESNGFQINENVELDRANAALNEVKASFENSVAALNEAREQVETLERKLILVEATAELTDTQREKVTELLEAVSFDSREEYVNGLGLIVEQVSRPAAPAVAEGIDTVVLEEQVEAPVAKKPQNETAVRWARSMIK